jgi:hypothetical protein
MVHLVKSYYKYLLRRLNIALSTVYQLIGPIEGHPSPKYDLYVALHLWGNVPLALVCVGGHPTCKINDMVREYPMVLS